MAYRSTKLPMFPLPTFDESPSLPQWPLFLLRDGVTLYLEDQLLRMTLDDALIMRGTGYRVEYLYLASGWPQYRLYRSNHLIGFTYWQSATSRPHCGMYLAALMATFGFTKRNTYLVIGGAKTPIDAPTQRLPSLRTPLEETPLMLVA